MKTFLSKSITTEKRDGSIVVSRQRTSSGFSCISIKVGEQSILISTDSWKDEYEQAAHDLADAIHEIATNRCALPVESSEA